MWTTTPHIAALSVPTTDPSNTKCYTTKHLITGNRTSTQSEQQLPTYSNASQRSILLATARVIIFNPDNGLQATLNALIDQGSEATIVSEHVVQSLHLTRTSIAGVGQGLSLADPQYYRPKRVDLIIGVDLMAQIILPGIKVGAPNEPIAQNTQLGWILSGRTQPPREATHVVCHQAVLDTESLLKQFCEVESVPERRLNTAEDVWCETFFQQTHKRQPTGRYMVRLPLKTIFDPSMTLGKSHQIALNRYLQLERRLTKTPEAWQRYSDGIKEYFKLNQLAPATTSERQSTTVSDSQHHCSSCVLPHHAVYKEESLSTKLRIVFDASANTSNGRSLNDILCVGPTLQNDMSAVILNWRQYRYAFTADIQRMYRCIDVHPEDSEYQRI
ncbi:uncharacterized protein LOC118757211 [Rhagoletis pomonella]|uniref:uncharacterized protein LOC118757211 n=1 Tax=Rhagoletis pomonella TaxID=28610 RepID=UPI00177ACC89|nr:uncharacterized protein LOC118757211 [Rhagoletis pomonella]